MTRINFMLAFFLGCVQIVNAKEWPLEDEKYFYSEGYGNTKMESMDKAKSELIGRFYSNVESSSENVKTVETINGSTKVTGKGKIRTKVETLNLPIAPVKEVDSAVFKGQYVTVIRVEKEKQNSLLAIDVNNVNSALIRWLDKHSGSMGYSCYLDVPDMVLDLEKATIYKIILPEVSPKYFVDNIKKANSLISDCSSRNTVYVKKSSGSRCGVELFEYVKTIIPSGIVSSVKDSSSGVLVVDCEEASRSVSDGLRYVSKASFQLYDEKNHLLEKNEVRGNGFSFSGNVSEAREQSIDQLKENVVKNGVFKAWK